MLKTSPDGQRGGLASLSGLEKKLTGSEPADSDVPGPVRRAARLMLGGGALTVLLGVFQIIVAIVNSNALTDAKGQRLSGGQIAGGLTEILILEYLIPAALWVIMARFNRAGRGWARICASVLCAIDTVFTYGLVNSLTAGQTITVADIVFIVLSIASWVLGVLAVALVWRGESSEYFRSRSARS